MGKKNILNYQEKVTGWDRLVFPSVPGENHQEQKRIDVRKLESNLQIHSNE
jgi:hypothetical protein